MAEHRHRPKSSRDECYSGPVSDQQNPSAHGGIVQVDQCACGAERRTNYNGNHVERGAWYVPYDGQRGADA